MEPVQHTPSVGHGSDEPGRQPQERSHRSRQDPPQHCRYEHEAYGEGSEDGLPEAAATLLPLKLGPLTDPPQVVGPQLVFEGELFYRASPSPELT